MKTLKRGILLLSVFCLAFTLQNCENEVFEIAEEELLETKEEEDSKIALTDFKIVQDGIKTSNNQDQTTSAKGAIVKPPGLGDILYYRVSFISTATPMQMLGVVHGVLGVTTYTSDAYHTYNSQTKMFKFYSDDKAAVDSYLANNSSLIQEHIENPTVLHITYEPGVSEVIKNEIRADFNIIVIMDPNGQNESWGWQGCCEEGEACDDLNGTDYIYSPLVSASL